jgi:threonylcarbamoyladenosine tRNA methylthiotransferase MtaB
MPHLHLSLQHGDDLILKRMKRRHSSAEAVAFCERVRALRPDASFGADMIAGFPTETEDMFANAERHAEECGIAHLHVFPYSPRAGTPAARMPQLDRALVKERAGRLRDTGKRLHETHLDSMIGRDVTILVENNGLAHTENFTLVDAAGLKPRALVPVTITGHNGKHLTMRPALAAAVASLRN